LHFLCDIDDECDPPSIRTFGFPPVPDITGAEHAIENLLLAKAGRARFIQQPAPQGETAQSSLNILRAELQAAIKAELRLGETVQWFSQPVSYVTVRDFVVNMLLFCIYFVGLFLFHGYLKRIMPFVAEFCLGLLLMACIVLIMHWLMGTSKAVAQKTVYLVTNMRAITIVLKGKKRSVWSALPQEFIEHSIKNNLDGTKDIMFVSEHAKNNKISLENSVGFEGVPNSANAEKALDELRQSLN
jgi:hypothetical protein